MGLPRHELGSALAQVRSHPLQDARLWAGLNATSLPWIAPNMDQHKAGWGRCDTSTKSSAPGRMLPASSLCSLWLRVYPCLCNGEGGSLLGPPSPLPPALPGSILGFRARRWLLFVLTQSCCGRCSDSSHGGLTPSLPFCCLLGTLEVLLWAGPLHGVLWWSLSPFMGCGVCQDSWMLGWMGFRSAKQGGCSGFPALNVLLGASSGSRGAAEGDCGMQLSGC